MILPDRVLSKIADPTERRRLGKAGLLRAECIIKAGLELEREEHKRFLGYLDREEYAYCHCRTDKRTTANLGVADFLIPAYRLAIEFKRCGEELSVKQEEWRARHEARGGIYHVVETYQQAFDILNAMGL